MASAGTTARFTSPRVRNPRPVWSARSFAGGVLVVVIIASIVLLFGERSLLVRAEWVTAFASGLLWLFLFIGLYRGVRVRRDEPLPERKPVEAADSSDASARTLEGLLDVTSFGDEFIGGVIALVFWILFAVLLVMFLPTLLEGASYALLVLVGSLSWIFRRALRQVFLHGRQCRGRIGASLARASVFTFLYSGWLLALLMMARGAIR